MEFTSLFERSRSQCDGLYRNSCFSGAPPDQVIQSNACLRKKSNNKNDTTTLQADMTGTQHVTTTRSRHTRRAVLVFGLTVAAFQTFFMEKEEEEEEKKRHRMVSYARGVRTAALRDLFFSRFGALDSAFFLAMFRCTRYQFEILYHKIGPYLQVLVHHNNELARRNSNRRCLKVEEKICIALRVSGGATSTDAAWGFGCHRTLVKRVFLKFLLAVSKSTIGPICYPTTPEEFKKVANGFAERTTRQNAAIYHACGGAGDGLAARIKPVSLRECSNPLGYINRKGFYSINLQSINDSRLRFLYVNLETQGATHDSTAFFATKFSKQFLDANPDPPKDEHGRAYWLALDDAYGQHNSRIVTPWPGRNLITTAPFKDSFNYHMSGGFRNSAERTYGILLARFGIFWRPLDFQLHLIPFVIYSLCRLHNFFIDVGKNQDSPNKATGLGYYGSRKNDTPRVTVQDEEEQGGPTGYDDQVYHQWMVSDDLMQAQRARTGGVGGSEKIRESITKNLEMLGIRRPANKLGRLRSVLVD
jgi:hypothetical protein